MYRNGRREKECGEGLGGLVAVTKTNKEAAQQLRSFHLEIRITPRSDIDIKQNHPSVALIADQGISNGDLQTIKFDVTNGSTTSTNSNHRLHRLLCFAAFII